MQKVGWWVCRKVENWVEWSVDKRVGELVVTKGENLADWLGGMKVESMVE